MIHPVDIAASARLARLHARCFEVGWTRREFAALLRARGVRALLAGRPERPGEDRGLALSHALEDEAEILTIAVVPGSRRGGTGRLLLAAVEELCRDQGARRLCLEVAVDNVAARRLYEDAGLAVRSRRDGYHESPDGGQVDGLVMSKDL